MIQNIFFNMNMEYNLLTSMYTMIISNAHSVYNIVKKRQFAKMFYMCNSMLWQSCTANENVFWFALQVGGVIKNLSYLNITK